MGYGIDAAAIEGRHGGTESLRTQHGGDVLDRRTIGGSSKRPSGSRCTSHSSMWPVAKSTACVVAARRAGEGRRAPTAVGVLILKAYSSKSCEHFGGPLVLAVDRLFVRGPPFQGETQGHRVAVAAVGRGGPGTTNLFDCTIRSSDHSSPRSFFQVAR